MREQRDTDRFSRRRILETGLVGGALGLSGCLRLGESGNDTTTPPPASTETATSRPTDDPTARASDTPTAEPTDTPTSRPTDTPTSRPTDTPSARDGFERETVDAWSISGNCSDKRISAQRARRGSRSLLLSSGQSGGPCVAQRRIDATLPDSPATFSASLYDASSDPDSPLVEYSNSGSRGSADAIRVDPEAGRETRFVTFDAAGEVISRETFDPIEGDQWYDVTITVDTSTDSAEITLENQSGTVASATLDTSGADQYTYVHLIAGGYAGGETYFDDVSLGPE